MDHEVFFENLGKEADEGKRFYKLLPAFKAIQSLQSKTEFHVLAMLINEADGSKTCLTHKEVLQRQKKYESVLNHPEVTPCPDLHKLAVDAIPDAENLCRFIYIGRGLLHHKETVKQACCWTQHHNARTSQLCHRAALGRCTLSEGVSVAD